VNRCRSRAVGMGITVQHPMPARVNLSGHDGLIRLFFLCPPLPCPRWYSREFIINRRAFARFLLAIPTPASHRRFKRSRGPSSIDSNRDRRRCGIGEGRTRCQLALQPTFSHFRLRRECLETTWAAGNEGCGCQSAVIIHAPPCSCIVAFPVFSHSCGCCRSYRYGIMHPLTASQFLSVKSADSKITIRCRQKTL